MGADRPGEPMRLTFDALPEPTMLVLGGSSSIALANRRAEDLFGYSGEELVGRRLDELVAARHRERAAAALVSRRGVFDLCCVRKDGSEIEVQVSVGALEPPAAAPGSSVLVLRPGLALTQALVRLLSSAPDAIVIVRRDGRIVLTNDRVEVLFGYRAEELLGRPIEALIPERFAEKHVQLREAYFREPTVLLAHARTGGIIGRRKDGSEFPADIMLSPINTETGLLAVASIRDATDRKNMEEARLTAARAEEALHLRDEFVRLAAHELRTPLTPMRVVADRILRDAAHARALDASLARQLDDGMQRLEGTVEELVECASVLAGELTLSRAEMDLAEVVREEVDRARRAAERAGAQMTLSASPSLKGTWDRRGIRRVVAELLSNALKFDGGAPIAVSLERRGDMAVLTVRDGGVGVAPENRAKLFERFARFESSKHYGGLGIGLWLARQVIEAHGGHIGVRGEGEGATFQVDLPLAS